MFVVIGRLCRNATTDLFVFYGVAKSALLTTSIFPAYAFLKKTRCFSKKVPMFLEKGS